MRNTLTIGLLLCLPTVVLLVSVSLAALIGKLRRTLTRRCWDLPMAEPDREELRDDANSLSSAPAGPLSGYPAGRCVRPGTTHHQGGTPRSQSRIRS